MSLKRALNQVKEFDLPGSKVIDYEYLKKLLRDRFDKQDCDKEECRKIIRIYQHFDWEILELISDLKTGH